MSEVKSRISNAKEIFRTIDIELSRLSACGPQEKGIIIRKLKAINEELEGGVISIIKREELKKIQGAYEKGRDV